MRLAATLRLLVAVATTMSVFGQNTTEPPDSAMNMTEPPVDAEPPAAISNGTSSGMCTLCDNGQTPIENPTNVFFRNTDFNCSGLISDLANKSSSLAVNSTECKDMQLLAWQIGCCDFPPFLYCDMCEGGAEFKKGNEIPLGTADNPSCSAFEYSLIALNGVFEAGSCADTHLRRAGFYCECPGVEQQCSLCPDKSSPGFPSKRDKFVNFANCRELEYFYSIFTEDECKDAPFNVGVDMGAFCGCPGVEANNTCTLCLNGAAVEDRSYEYKPGVTCGEAFDYAPFIIRDTFCEPWAEEPRALCCPSSGAYAFVSLLLVIGMGMWTTLWNLV